MTAMKAAPLLPENNDGSSYLYISLCDPTPESILRETPCAHHQCASLATSRRNATFHAASLLSLRRVKRLTHIAPLLQARLYLINDLLEAPASRGLCAARRDLLQIGYRAQGCSADLPRIFRQRPATRVR